MREKGAKAMDKEGAIRVAVDCLNSADIQKFGLVDKANCKRFTESVLYLVKVNYER